MDTLEKILLSQEFPLYFVTVTCSLYTAYCHYRLDALTRKVNTLPVLLKAIGHEREAMTAAWVEQMEYVKEFMDKDHQRIEDGIAKIKVWFASPEYEKIVIKTVQALAEENAKEQHV